jgi:hypothetical protein
MGDGSVAITHWGSMAVQGWGYQREREKSWQGWPRAPPLLFDAKQKRQAERVFRSSLMTHKYRGCIVVLSINKSVEPNEEQKVLMSGFDQGITVNTSKQVFRSIW